MPRARNIKPSLYLNEILGKADPLLTILFTSLWCLADKEGRLEDRPERIRIETFPYRSNINIEGMLRELQGSGFIKRYKVSDSQFIEVINFKKHQRPHHTEKESILPPCDAKALIIKDNGYLTEKSTLDNGSLTVVERSDSLIPDLLIPDTGYLITEKAPRRKNIEDSDFERFWTEYPKRPGANKTKAFELWNRNLKNGEYPETMQSGAYRYRKYCEATNKEPEYILQAATFLGRDKHYLLDWKYEGSRNSNQKWLDNMRGKGADDGFTFDAE